MTNLPLYRVVLFAAVGMLIAARFLRASRRRPAQVLYVIGCVLVLVGALGEFWPYFTNAR